MKPFQPFEMERFMSLHEQEVEINLSESGVHPLTLGELLEDHPEKIGELLTAGLGYPHVNGIPELRNNIASLYEGASPNNVLVTVGAIEANYNTVLTLLHNGGEIAVMLPNYMQIWGMAKNHGIPMTTFQLREDREWALDAEELNEAVTPRTRLIAVCNPNNPTGHILSEAEMEAVVAAAERVGAWILADEVYIGAERTTDTETPSFYGRYPRVVAVGSTSKAYGLPGLRIGWAAGPVPAVDEIWARHEYTSIGATALANRLAALALSPEVRPRLIRRGREYIRKGFPILEDRLGSHGKPFELTPPQASAVAFLRFGPEINSTRLAERLRREKSVLVVPGDHFGMDRHLRVGFGMPLDTLKAGLDRIGELMRDLP